MRDDFSDDEQEVLAMHVYSGRIKSRVREIKPRHHGAILKRFVAKIEHVSKSDASSMLEKINVFISFCWTWRRDEAVNQIAIYLKQQNDLKVWVNLKDKEGFDYETMAKGIEDSDIVLCLFGRDYAETPNCRREMEYAAFRNKEILPIRLDRDYRPEGWLLCVFKSQTRLDYFEEDSFAATASKIYHYIRSVKTTPHAQSTLPLSDMPAALKLRTVGVPTFAKMGQFNRLKEEARILAQIKRVAKAPYEGCLVISGEPGVGKTTTMSRLLLDEKNQAFLVNECNLTRIVWLNCFEYSTFDEKAFVDQIIQLVKEVELFDPAANFTSLQSLIHYFKKRAIRIAYIFDDMFSSDLLTFFMEKQIEPPICIVITEDSKSLNNGGLIQKVENILDPLNHVAIQDALKATFELGKFLRDGQLAKLAKHCSGLPLTCNLTAARLLSCSEVVADYKILKNLTDFTQIFNGNLNQMDESLRRLFYAFLFFNPNEPVSMFDLGVLWGFDLNEANICGLRGVCRAFERQALVRRVKRHLSEENQANNTENKLNDTFSLDDSTEDRFLVHRLLFDATLDRAKVDFCLQDGDGLNYDESLYKIRLILISGHVADADAEKDFDEAHLNVLLAMLKYQRISLLERIISKLDVKSLARICLRKSVQTVGMSFLHRLYHFSKWDMSPFTGNMFQQPISGAQQASYLPNPSYRLIDKFLTKFIESKGGYKLLWRVVSEPRNGYPHSCLYVDILDDAQNDHYLVDRSPLLTKLSCWLPVHTQAKWVAKLFSSQNKRPHEIVQAAFAGKLDDVKRLAPRCTDERVQNQVAHVAARLGHLQILKFLNDRFLSTLRSEDDDGSRQLLIMVAARNGNVDVVRYLGGRWSASCRLVDWQGKCAIHFAARNGHLNCVEVLYGQDPDAALVQDSDGYTALTAAAAEGRLDVVKFLCGKLKPPDLLLKTKELNGTALSVAASAGHLETVQYLYSKYEPIDLAKALSTASVTGRLGVINFLLEKQPFLGQIVDSDLQFTPLMLASANGHLDCVASLYGRCEESVEVLGIKVTAIMVAAASGHLNVVQWLFFKDPIMARLKPTDGNSAMELAEKMGHRAIAQFLRESTF